MSFVAENYIPQKKICYYPKNFFKKDCDETIKNAFIEYSTKMGTRKNNVIILKHF